MTMWLTLAAAILCEVCGTLSMRFAAQGRRVFYVAVAVGYGLAFFFLSLALSAGMPLGVAYGIWSATGVALMALLARVLFKEPLTRTMLAGIVLIVGGVLLIEMGAGH